MSLVEIVGQHIELSRQQRWSHLLTLAIAALAMLYGIHMRDSVLNATTTYTNVQAGIRAHYPQNWLIDEAGDYVFRVRDMMRVGYKTTIMVQTIPVGPNASARTVFDTLNINRPQTLLGYKPISREDIILPDDSPAVVLDYVLVDVETNPFLESLHTIVQGRDILTIRRGQAILITFRADAQSFSEEVAIFNRFLNSLEFS